MSSQLDFHAFLLTNTGTRLERFARALTATIRPGDAVLDLGAGSGVLSILACRAGARRVYAIEESDSAAFARALVPPTPFADRIQIIQARSFDVTLPEPVDAIVADVHSTFGLQERGLAAIVDARDRLMKPGGSMVPARMTLLAAPVEAPALYADKVDRWQRAVMDIDLSPVRTFAVNTAHPARVDPADLLAPPEPLAVIDFAHATSLHLGGRIRLVASRAGTLHGICGGMRSTLIDGVELGNLPGDAGSSNFAHAFLPLDTPVAVAAGDEIEVRVDMYDGDDIRWVVSVDGPGHAAPQRFAHSTFLARALSKELLKKRDPGYRPTLTHRGRLERDLLQQFDGTRTVRDLEQWLAGSAGDGLSGDRLTELLVTTIERCG